MEDDPASFCKFCVFLVLRTMKAWADWYECTSVRDSNEPRPLRQDHGLMQGSICSKHAQLVKRCYSDAFSLLRLMCVCVCGEQLKKSLNRTKKRIPCNQLKLRQVISCNKCNCLLSSLYLWRSKMAASGCWRVSCIHITGPHSQTLCCVYICLTAYGVMKTDSLIPTPPL